MTADEAHINWIAYALIVALAPAAAFADPIPGPINAHVVSVYDGDTMTVDAEHRWREGPIRLEPPCSGDRIGMSAFGY